MTGNESGTTPPTERGTDDEIRLSVRNVGGIAETTLSLSPGVTLVSGRNASNKSSLLRALSGVLGGPVPPLKSDADEGAVRLETGGETYALDLARTGSGTVTERSAPYADADALCELFVSLTEQNPIRQAVLAGEDLHDLLLRPVDTAAIEAEIERLSAEKWSIEERLDELDGMAARLPGLRARRDDLRAELEEVEAALRERRAEIEELEDAVGADDGPSELAEKREERNEVRARIGTQEEAVESLTAEREEVAERLAALDGTDTDTTVPELESELEGLHQQKQQLTSVINALSPIVEMNAQLLDDDGEIPDRMTDDDIVAELDPASRTVTCWTCGSTVEQAEIEEQVDAVRGIIREKRNQRDTITERIQMLTEQKRELEERQDELARLRERRDRLGDEIAERRAQLETLRDRQQALEREIAELRTETTTATEAERRLSECYEAVSDLEYERGQLANDLESVEAELEELEAALADRAELEERHESVAAELERQRERIDTVERDLVATFNEMMQRVLDALAYESVDRIWLERHTAGEGADREASFELHVVRSEADGTAYDDTVGTLSRSERETIGLVVALAGYLVHDVHEVVPFVVVDAVEMFDADRIRSLMAHFDEYADYVITAVLPEEGAELADTYDAIPTAALAADS